MGSFYSGMLVSSAEPRGRELFIVGKRGKRTSVCRTAHSPTGSQFRDIAFAG